MENDYYMYFDECNNTKITKEEYLKFIEKVLYSKIKGISTPPTKPKASPLFLRDYGYPPFEYGKFPIYLLYRFMRYKQKRDSKSCVNESAETQEMWEKFVNKFNGYIFSPKQWDDIVNTYWDHYRKYGSLY